MVGCISPERKLLVALSAGLQRIAINGKKIRESEKSLQSDPNIIKNGTPPPREAGEVLGLPKNYGFDCLECPYVCASSTTMWQHGYGEPPLGHKWTVGQEPQPFKRTWVQVFSRLTSSLTFARPSFQQITTSNIWPSMSPNIDPRNHESA
jgi:hypothetical protein